MQMVNIIKPGEGDEQDLFATVPALSLPHHHRAGWRVLDESPEPDPAEDLKPVRAKGKAAGSQAAAAADSSNKEGE